jgi:hypothetical protein
VSPAPRTGFGDEAGGTPGSTPFGDGRHGGDRPRRHRTRVMGGQGGGRGWWQAWCTEPGCTWRGSTLPQRVGSRRQAAEEAEGHEEATGGYLD